MAVLQAHVAEAHRSSWEVEPAAGLGGAEF